MYLDDKPQGLPPHREHGVKPEITKLSQAIREGAKLRHQCFGRTFRDGGSCALGAAAEALGGYGLEMTEAGRLIGERLYGDQGYLWTRMLGSEYVTDAIWMKNDHTQWTREQIADWLESQGL